MAKQVIREFCPADRYTYDFKACSYDKGWAQLDTSQDASYYGTWINPTRREIFVYCEGDCILTRVDTDADLVREVAEIKAWNDRQGYRFIGIDPGTPGTKIEDELINTGLGQFFSVAG